MHDILAKLGEDAFSAKVILALIPLFGVLGGALASWIVASRNVYINSITAERSKWLEKIRSTISEFQAAVTIFNFRSDYVDAVARQKKEGNPVEQADFEALERISRLAVTIQLQLNPDGETDQNIIALVRQMSISRFGEGRLLVRAEDLLTRHCQWLLKAEWEKVKWEAGSILYKARHCLDERRRLRAYRDFAAGPGSIGDTVSRLQSALTKGDAETASARTSADA